MLLCIIRFYISFIHMTIIFRDDVYSLIYHVQCCVSYVSTLPLYIYIYINHFNLYIYTHKPFSSTFPALSRHGSAPPTYQGSLMAPSAPSRSRLRGVAVRNINPGCVRTLFCFVVLMRHCFFVFVFFRPQFPRHATLCTVARDEKCPDSIRLPVRGGALVWVEIC